ncbi:MAG: HlyD family efflux transporter periplasmic adaptor subunit [Planctomycetes bacterium]|nr:HlyD family efflux transporter periplasmic adaptor subunit [Planctomycetota bacterium]
MKNYANKSNRQAKKRSKLLLLVLLFVVVAVPVSWLLAAKIKGNSSLDATKGGIFPVRLDNLTITVTEGGSIKAHKSIEYKCKVERGRETGELKILSVVPAGTYVTQEDVDSNMILLQLDSSGLEERLIQEDMELSGDKENVNSATESRDIQKIQNESDIADANLKVRFAQLDLQKYLGAELANKLVKDVSEESNLTEHISPFLGEVKTDPNMLEGSAAGEELKKLRDDIVMAEGRLKTAQDTLTGTIKLHDANYVSDLDLQKDELNLQNQTFSKESGEVALALFKEYDFPKNAEQFLSDYVEAGRQLQRVFAQCRSRLAQTQVRLASAQEQLYWQEKRVKEINQNIEYCTVKAQAPGLVVYGTGGSDDMYRSMRYRGGGSSGVIAEGESVSEGQTILSMPDTATMIAEIGVHETEIDKVRVGQPATIVMDAFPDKVLDGEVTEVGSLPDQQRGFMNPDLKVYKTLVRIDGTHDFLKSRMSCKVQILVEDLEDAIVVPIQVVSNRGGRKVCYVKGSQGQEERVVRTGLFNDTFVEVIEGLEVGEEVMLNPPLFSELGSPASFQQQQPKPRKRTSSGAADANDTEARSQGRGARAGRSGEGQRTRRSRPSEGGGQQGAGPPQSGGPPRQPGAKLPQGGGQMQLTDEMATKILSGLKQFDPAKAKELEEMKKSNPTKFKAELMKAMQGMRNKMRQGGGGTRPGQGGSGMRQGQGGSDTRQGQGNAGSRQNR